MAQTFQLLLLGLPEIAWRDQSFALARRQARALLYYLANELQPVPRDRLIFLLWPDTPDGTARRNLTRLLSYLRNVLPHSDLLVTNKAGVALNPELVTSDAAQFGDLCAAEDVTGWETAISLYRGRFLDGFALPDSPEFDQWLSQAQRQYERTYLKMLHKLVTTKIKNRDHSAAIQYAQKYLATDDLAEAIHRQLITLYAATGNRSAALRQYEQCAIILERELGVPPLPETRAAYEAARNGTQPPPSPARPKPAWTILPGLDLPLIGRDEAWNALVDAYRRYQRGGVIFISGEAGVGKSRLMQEFATAQSGLVLTGN
ncbi:MAG: BTAD domain-containing putative transcriptional regulator, partial [Anaerolineae bacterium]|nr:BTAD domain-containing putative transcriptional regulator [Anaerolineae bacterium]